MYKYFFGCLIDQPWREEKASAQEDLSAKEQGNQLYFIYTENEKEIAQGHFTHETKSP